MTPTNASDVETFDNSFGEGNLIIYNSDGEQVELERLPNIYVVAPFSDNVGRICKEGDDVCKVDANFCSTLNTRWAWALLLIVITPLSDYHSKMPVENNI